ncbi:GNAT family N-acetyltransferase [Deinococcus yavapaiensis]|uniref:RimJ/RimL family protein N-acetyltransferase n=1 Tax=Deinococcus yavapaiensis KR-236 TaxID=694435 RepID=A0A318S9A1_9DEIO|nr:GNAT family protein [Deinococcus yavapaiensis]PYE53033.1 RimJ/RimL family protein N-acetyltransferase [Deinococcus yavapaiensis KR-236]
MKLSPVTLRGALVTLEPLTLDHVPALAAAAVKARDAADITSIPLGEAAVTAYVRAAISAFEAGRALPFATLNASGVAVGSTRFGNVEFWSWPDGRTSVTPDALEIGWTWLVPTARRTGLNREAKRLMLSHAFDVLRVKRVTLKTDARNARSRAAILGIGATFEGVLRAHVPAVDGGVRDSAMYSILAAEWPNVKRRLEAR